MTYLIISLGQTKKKALTLENLKTSFFFTDLDTLRCKASDFTSTAVLLWLC